MSIHNGDNGSLSPTVPNDAAMDRAGYLRHDPRPIEPPVSPVPRRRRPLWRAFVLPVVIATACALGAHYRATHMQKLYTTEATVWFPAAGGSGMGGAFSQFMGGPPTDSAGNVSVLGSMYTAPQFGSGPNTAMSAMSTNRCTSEVVHLLRLDQRWHVSQGDAMARVQKEVAYGVDRNGFLAISATDPNPALAKRIVDAYIEAMQDVSTQMSVAYTRTVQQAVQHKYEAAQAKLDQEAAELVRIQTGNLRAAPLGPSAAGTYADLASQRLAAQTELDTVQAQIAAQKSQAARAYSSPGLAANVPFAQSDVENLRKAESDFAVAKQTLGPDNPQYQDAQIRLDQARRQVNDEKNRQLTAVKTGISPAVADLYSQQASLRAKIGGISSALGTMRAAMVSLPANKMREDQLTDQLALQRDTVKTLEVAAQQAELAEQRDVPAFRVIDAATIPGAPNMPRVLFMTAFAAIAGFLLTLAVQAARSAARQPRLMAGMRRLTEKYVLLDPYDIPELPSSYDDTHAGSNGHALDEPREHGGDSERGRLLDSPRARGGAEPGAGP